MLKTPCKTFLILLLSTLALGCDRETGPRWSYICLEAESGERECHPQLADKEHLLTLLREQEAWYLLAGHGEFRHIAAELTIPAGSGDDPIRIAVDRDDQACSFTHCRLKLSEQVIESMIRSDQFSVTLTRVRIAKQSVRTVDTTETFTTRGLRATLRQAGG